MKQNEGQKDHVTGTPNEEALKLLIESFVNFLVEDNLVNYGKQTDLDN